MKSIIFRAITSMVIGCLLMAYPEKVTSWLVVLIGGLFLVPGIYSMVSYWTMRKEGSLQMGLPVVGAGSALLGIWMILDSSFFIRAFMAGIAVVLILAGVTRIIGNFQSRKYAHVPLVFYIFPVLLILVSVYVLSNPLEAAGIPIYILGVSMVVYGILEIWNAIWLHNRIKAVMAEEAEAGRYSRLDDPSITDAEIVE